MEIIKEQLKAVVGGEYVICEPEDLKSYAQDNITFIPPRFPLLAVKPGSVEEIQAVLKIAVLNKLPVIPSSSRTNGHGSSIPSIPGVIIDLRRLNKIHLIDDLCRNAVIEPGVTFAELQKSAKAHGLRVLTPIELPAESSVISTYVEMTPLYAWPKYGTESILTMEALLPNGELLKTGMAAIPVMDKAYFPFGTMPSYLNKVFCGAQGTLGIVTRATIKLKTDFKTQRVLFISFTSFEACFPVLKEIKRLDSPVEFFIADATYLAGLLSGDHETFSSLQHTLSPQTAVLVLRGEKEQIEYQVADLTELAEKMNVELLDTLPADRGAAKKLLQEIEFPDGYEKFKRIKGYYGVIPFICMTRQIPIFNRVVADIARGFGYDVKNIGALLLPVEPSRVHFQYAFYTGPEGSEDYRAVEKLFGTVSSTLLRMGAFFSRPYGSWPGQVYAKAGSYKAMLKQIKEAIDPENIMNPGSSTFKAVNDMAHEYCYPFTRKRLGDYYEMTWRCAKCGYCKNVFPSDTEHERFGRQCPPGDRFKFEPYFASGRSELARRLIEGKQGLTERLRHILYTCTTCGACEEWCQATQWRYPLKLEMEMRKYFVRQGGELLPQHKRIVENIRKSCNRLNRNNRDRLGWLGDMAPQERHHADIVYFVGCRSSFNRTEIAQNAHALLTRKLGIPLFFLADERCCGRPLLDIGAEDAAVELMKHNVAQIASSGAQTVIFSCPECFSTFSNIEKFGIPRKFKALHVSQFLIPAIKESNLLLRAQKARAVFHDPCYLGRHQGVYDEPRAILSSIPGLELVEMPRNRKNAWCCGAGGGVQEAFPQYSQWIARERFEEIKQVQADLIITSCPGCKENLWSSARAAGMVIKDLMEVVNEVAEG